MSPEQLEGKEADARSDIFSFGAMLYEMATGKKAFEAKSHASLIAAILKDDPRPMRELSRWHRRSSRASSNRVLRKIPTNARKAPTI